MKLSTILIVVIVAAVAGGILWYEKHEKASEAGKEPAAAEKGADDAEGPQVARDANGNVVISITDEVQGEMGLKVARPEASQMSPEVKGYGRVQDPSLLAASLTEIAVAEAAYAASSNELARAKVLQGQGNASARAFQTAEAAAIRDRLAFQTARDKLTLAWGNIFVGETNLPDFTRALASRDSALVRVDLPAGESISNSPAGARITGMVSGNADAKLLGPAPAVDPQAQGQGFLFLVNSNSARLAPGEAVVAFLKLPGAAKPGVMIPREAVVRTEGAGWIYVMNSDGEGFTRVEIPLDHPTGAGWFVGKGVTADNYVVTTGAQQLLSTELKGKGD